MDFGLSVGLTIGDPEVVGALANCLFQIWHGIFLANDPPSPGQKTCSRRVNEILTAGVGGPDGLHPTHAGYIKIRDAFIAAIDS